MMTVIDFFTEERSAEIFLRQLLPKILPESINWNIYSFNGKHEMLKKLPQRLRAYNHRPLLSNKIVILIDRDSNDCRRLKSQLEEIVSEAGLVTKTVNGDSFQVVTRIVIEELEAWYFGDGWALNAAYPFLPKNIGEGRRFRDPDLIHDPPGVLSSLLRKKYGDVRLPKLEIAEEITKHMDPNRNKSKSFQVFCDGVRICAGIRRN